ncbi:uncharacterized protein ACMZJ9_009976 [Mantella aurantiaca]
MIGEDVTIPCSFTINNPPIAQKFLAIFWYFQEKQILNFQNAKVTASDPRVSYTGRAEDGIADLSISNINITDGGIYKCVILYTPKREEKEIRLDIQAPPQITITDKLVVNNRENVLHCAISGFYPVDIDIKWLRDGEILDNVIMEKPERNPDGTYNMRSSVMIIPTKEDRTFSCRVQHESLTVPLQEDFHLVYGALPTVHITSQAFRLNVEQNLVCSASGFYPESITVNWFLNGTLVENAKTRRISISAVDSVYHFTPTGQNWGAELSCVVKHGTLITPHVERLLVQGPDLRANYKTHVIVVTVLLILILGIVTFYALCMKKRKKSFPKVREVTRSPGGMFSLDVDHFYPEDITVHWEVMQPPSSTKPHPITSSILMHQNQDGTFNATSTCESLRGEIREDESYIVRALVEHKKLKHPSQREWKSDDKENRDFLAQPEVEMIQIPKLFVSQQTQLRCTISHFYPDVLTVNWIKKENGKEELIDIVNNEKYKIPNSKSQLQPDKTFTRTALLEVFPSLEDVGSEVICRVIHSSLKEPIERTTGSLQVMVKPEAPQCIQLLMKDSGDMVASINLSSFYPKGIMITWTYGPTQKKTSQETYGSTQKKTSQETYGPAQEKKTSQETYGPAQEKTSQETYGPAQEKKTSQETYGPAQEKKTSEETVSDNPDGTFTVTSLCTISGDLFENPQFRVRVTWNHPSMENPEYREISVQDPDFPWCPQITEITPLILQVRTETTVRCTISDYFSENLQVTWIEKKGKHLTDCTQARRQYHIPPIRHERMQDNSYQCSPSLSFTPTSFEEDLEFICKVDHSSLKRPIEGSTGSARAKVAPEKTDVKMTPFGSDQVLCSLNIKKFYPQDISITWSNEEPNTANLPSTKRIIQTDDEKTVDAVSECTIPWKYLESSVSVTWTHESLQEPGNRDLRLKGTETYTDMTMQSVQQNKTIQT